MEKILFINGSPHQNGETYQIGEALLKDKEHDVLQMVDYKVSQYGQVFEDDQIKDIFNEIKKADTIVIGSPVYWYTVSGLLKTFIDRTYMLPQAQELQGKKLYVFAQGSMPSQECHNHITYLFTRFAHLMNMELKGLVIGPVSQKNKIIQDLHFL